MYEMFLNAIYYLQNFINSLKHNNSIEIVINRTNIINLGLKLVRHKTKFIQKIIDLKL